MKRDRQRFWQRAGTALFASLLLFSGIANAYCGIDEAYVGDRTAPAASAEAAAHADNGRPADACPDIQNPDKEDAKPRAQWDIGVGVPLALGHPYPPPQFAAVLAARPAPIAEPVFHRFPRLLI